MTLVYVLSWAAVLSSAVLLTLVCVRRPPPLLWPSLPLAYGASFLWALGGMCRTIVTTPDALWFWRTVQYTGVIFLSLTWWWFSLGFAAWQGHPITWAGRLVRRGPLVVSAMMWVAMITNPWHGLFLSTHGRFSNEFRPLWLIHMANGYLLLAGCMILLAWLWWRVRGTAQVHQVNILLVGSTCPMVANVLYVADIVDFGLDPTVFAITVSGIVFFVGIYWHRLFSLSRVTLQNLVDREADAVITLNEQARLRYANAAAHALLHPDPLGPEADVLAALAPRLSMEDTPHTPLTRDTLLALLLEPAASAHGHLFRFAHDTCTWVRIGAVSIVDRRGLLQGQSLRIQDVTAQETDRRALAESEARYRLLFEEATDIIVTLDNRGCIADANPAAANFAGYAVEEILGRPFMDFVTPDSREAVAEVFAKHLRGETAPVTEVGMRAKDGQQLYLSVASRPRMEAGRVVAIEAIGRDITEQRRVAQEERDAFAMHEERRRLESLGMMAGGVAHDFNNLMVGMLGNAELAMMDLDEQSPIHQRMQHIRDSAERAARLTAQMLAYAGKHQITPQAVDLAQLVRQMRPLLRTLVPAGANLEYAIVPVPMVTGDPTQLHQVITALCANAGEALGDASAGTVTVRTGTRDLTAADLPSPVADDGTAPGTYTFVEVTDTGCGMDAETVARIFDPFFSTKFTGRGLGLAAVHGIVRAHGGVIRVDSTLGEGATVVLLLPVADAVAPTRQTAMVPAADWRGGGTVLVIDDEEDVRDIATTLLERLGFTVRTACDGQEGVDVFAEHPQDIAAVLLDFTMPNMMGDEVYALVRQLRADVPIVISSGYTAAEIPVPFQDDAHAYFLPKPYRAQTLAHTLQTLLQH